MVRKSRNTIHVTSELEMKLLAIEEEANALKDERAHEIIKSEQKPQDVAIQEMEEIPIPDDDKMKYMYLVKPQLNTLRKLIEAGSPTPTIADALQISHASLMRMKAHIPAVKEMFHLGQLVKVEKAQESLFQLAQQNVIEEQALTRDGEVVTLQKVVLPHFQAARYVVENHMPEVYATKHVVEHKSSIDSEKLNELLEKMTPELLEQAMQRAQAIDVEIVEEASSNES